MMHEKILSHEKIGKLLYCSVKLDQSCIHLMVRLTSNNPQIHCRQYKSSFLLYSHSKSILDLAYTEICHQIDNLYKSVYEKRPCTTCKCIII